MASNEDLDKIVKRVNYGIFGFGLIFLAFFAYQLTISINFISKTKPIIGEVVGMEYGFSSGNSGSGYSGGNSFQPIFSYTDEDGNIREGKSAFLSTSYNFATGSKVLIRVDLNDPSKVYMDGWVDTWAFSIIFFSIGALFTTLGGKNLYNIKTYKSIRGRRRKPKK